MNTNSNNQDNALLGDLAEDMILDPLGELAEPAEPAPRQPARDLPQMMRKIPVTLTLEVGSARISLHELMSIGPDSVVELDILAGEPLVIKVNGTPIGRAEVVVAGENYGLKVIDLDGLDLDMMTS
jgi:flagellar motor switch protein FliN